MSDDNQESTNKRSYEQTQEDEEHDIGPSLSEAVIQPQKKRKVLKFEKIYLKNLPSSEFYEKSYMHRDTINFVSVTKSDFILTASADGYLKMWSKKSDDGIEFVKHFKCHSGPIADMAVSANGEFCSTSSKDKVVKIFDVVNFDMINMLRLPYLPQCCCWVFAAGDPVPAIAVAEKDSPNIRIYDCKGSGEVLHTFDSLHSNPVVLMRFNPVYGAAMSVDAKGMMEYWTGPKHDYEFPKNVLWEFKTETDLFEFFKSKTTPLGLTVSDDGKKFATICKDRKIRIFNFLTGKMIKVLDESLQRFTDLQQNKQPQISSMEFGKRMATEKELEKSEAYNYCNLIFDRSGYFLFYPTIHGVKVFNLYTNQCVREIGKGENPRFLHLALFQGTASSPKSSLTVEMQASDNPALNTTNSDPILFCTAFKKNRFYLFSNREPVDKNEEKDRDIFNEKPTNEEIVSTAQDVSYMRTSNNAVLHTTMGDIHITLFDKECPKTVENFCVHGRNGYYNGHIIHRVIKGFMIQTGDPTGIGSGGESIWGGSFEDEFHKNLKHDQPFTVSMANAGPNTNGSQFFITLVPTPWLDKKHTVFGRVTKGMDVVQKISLLKTNKNDKPFEEVNIVSVTIK